MKLNKVKYKASNTEVRAVFFSIKTFMEYNKETGYAAMVTFINMSLLMLRLGKALLITKDSYIISIPVNEACSYCHYYEKGKLPVTNEFVEVAVRELYTLIDKQIK